MKKLQNFSESTYQTVKPEIDREAGVIKGVKILGSASKNGREYSPQAMREAAAIYEGLGVNTNHPSRSTPNVSRTIEEGVGWLQNVTVKPEGVFGDMHVIKSHPLAESIFEVAERKPDRFGLSHNAAGECVTRQGKTIVESIKSVRSVDLVQNPATNSSLFESEDPVPKTPFKKLIEALPAKSKDRKAFVALLEMDGMIDPALPVEVAAEGATPTAEEAAKSAFKAAINAILDDEAITWDETKTKVIEMIKTLAKMSGEEAAPSDTPADTPADEGDSTVTESLQEQVKSLSAKLADREATESVRALLESKQVAITPVRVNTLKRTTDKKEQAALLEDWLKADGPKAKPAPQRPAVSAPVPLLEDEDDAGYNPPTGKALASRYS